jgi:RNA polymerase sigma factor (sigma-70 family)
MRLGFLPPRTADRPTATAATAGTADVADEALLAAYAQGQADAFDRLYARHHQALYRFLRRLLAAMGPATVDEVFQDTWLKLVEQAPHWQPQGATVKTWLFTLAHHRAVDVLRRSGREQAWPDGGHGDGADAAPFEPQATAWSDWPPADLTEARFWRAAGQRLLDCLEHLPAAQKAAFLLHHDEGLRLDQLAEVLGTGAETAKTRLRYAMGRLRVCMGAYLPAAAHRSADKEAAP